MSDNKTAVITGASRGIGKAIAYRLAAEGYDLLLTCENNIGILQDIASDLNSQHNISCQAYKCDISDSNAVQDFLQNVKEVDVLVNNAGISHIGLLQDMTDEEWKRLMGVNLSGPFYMCRGVIPRMLKKHSGCIVNISSMWGQTGASMEVAYSASKGGLDALTKALAKELAPSNIRVNALSCGVIDTDMNRVFSREEREELAESIPIGRFADPSEVAEAVLNIINMPEYMTGQIIAMTGGF